MVVVMTALTGPEGGEFCVEPPPNADGKDSG
jgi:hypothetical protein